MQAIPAPAVPGTISTLPQAQQVPAVLALYGSAMKTLGRCMATRDDLIHWIQATP
jgi:hypothetical protein